MLRVWNTLHRHLEEFHPLSDKKVGLYNCGPTVYDPLTLGNLRAYVFVDVLKRTLLFLGYRVKHVMNITDVGHLTSDADEGEDKLEREAARRGKNAWELARLYEEMAVRDMDRLNWLRPDALPRATDHIKEQIALIRELEKKGFIYKTSDGVYFDTSKFPDYGRLSGQKLEDKQVGARVEVNPEKKHPTDFALWKFSSSDRKRQMEWPSPWGVGFPGWHIECSAMSAKYLGQPFDIHAGGADLIPVHHENEIAQSEAAKGKPLASYWLHNEFLLVDGRRMGKSEGNAYTLDDLIAKKFDPLAFRYYCLGTHYRQKMNFTWEGLAAAQQAFKKLQAVARGLTSGTRNLPAGRQDTEHGTSVVMKKFTAALEEDLSTPQALSVLWEMLKGDLAAEDKGFLLMKMDEVLGLRLEEIMGQPLEVPAEMMALAEERELLRQKRSWKQADALREKIQALGWQVEDREGGGFDLTPS